MWFSSGLASKQKNLFPTHYYSHKETLGYDLRRCQVALSAVSSLFSSNWAYKKKKAIWIIAQIPALVSTSFQATYLAAPNVALNGENWQHSTKITSIQSHTCHSSAPCPRCYQINNIPQKSHKVGQTIETQEKQKPPLNWARKEVILERNYPLQ